MKESAVCAFAAVAITMLAGSACGSPERTLVTDAGQGGQSGGSSGNGGTGGTIEDSGEGGSGGKSTGGSAGAEKGGAAGSAGYPCAVSDPCGKLACLHEGLCVAKLVDVGGGVFIDQTEVTRSQYGAWYPTANVTHQTEACSWNDTFEPPQVDCLVNAPVACSENCENHPQICVDWCDAYAYCSAIGKRLCGSRTVGAQLAHADYADPQKSQWYWACSAGVRTYPYGGLLSKSSLDGYVGNRCNGKELGKQTTVAVGSQGDCKTPEGVLDLSGNLWEWEDACTTTGDPEQDDCRKRGGGFDDDNTGLRCAADYDQVLPRKTADTNTGFRCCWP